jgi:hypothetical protein
MEDMNEIEKRKAPGREEVEVLGATFEEGKPAGEAMGKWNYKLTTREETLKYLQTGQRYFYSPSGEWFGSEKRKNPA